MDILYCGISTTQEKFESLLKTLGTMPFAQSKLEHLILEGFASNELIKSFEAISTLPVPRYPKYKKMIVNEPNDLLYGHKIKYTWFINLPVLKQLTTFFSNTSKMMGWARTYGKVKNRRIIFIYGTNPLNTIPAFITRWFYKTSVVTYITEVDSLRLFEDRNFIHKIKNKIYIGLSKAIEKSFDGYLLLSENMKEMIDLGDKPYAILEGMIAKEDEVNQLDIHEIKKNNEIIYAGTLNKRYGIKSLVESFLMADLEEEVLVIYGRGDYLKELEEITKIHSNVIYRGVKPNHEILKAEKQAKLLINPRPSDETFTRYSFPSKILEYMSTGTPALITKLEGIPNQYYEYCYFYTDQSVEAMARTLKSILNKPSSVLLEKGKSAKKFVLTEKNNINQTRKISEFLYKVITSKPLHK